MKFTCIRANDLTPAHLAAWERIQRGNPLLDSPFLRPEFTTTVAAVRRDIEVALLEENAQVVGFFPFQRTKWGVGKPVGWNMCDVQGIIAPEDLSFDMMELVRSCRLSAWDYYCVPAPQPALQAFHEEHVESAFMDLSQGFEAFCAARRHLASKNFKHVRRLWRKAEQEVGPMRFETYAPDPNAWLSLLSWKSEQYLRTRAVNVFAFPWTIELLERICAQRQDAFGGMLSALYFGDQLAAVELGLRSFRVNHSWFTAYNPTLCRYSPGNILTVLVAQASPSLGIHRIDLGKTKNMEYKARFMSGTHALARGSVSRGPVSRLIRQGWVHTCRWLKSSPLRGPAELTGQWTRPLRGWLALR